MRHSAGKRKANGLGSKARLWIIGLAVAGSSVLGSHSAHANTKHHSYSHVASRRTHYSHELAGRHTGHSHYASTGHHHYQNVSYHVHRPHVAAYYRHSGLQCVPYAREVSHIDLSGNAFLWWAEAAGRYARGNQPVEGAVLNFRAIGRMPLGHVAVVTAVLDSRTILVTQANWVPGTITNDVTVQDMSPNNDWSEVQVELGDTSKLGAPYPTYGFIYNQPASSTVIAASGQGNEVAEAPAAAPVSSEAPNRSLQ